jgi:hypothetical protein
MLLLGWIGSSPWPPTTSKDSISELELNSLEMRVKRLITYTKKTKSNPPETPEPTPAPILCRELKSVDMLVYLPIQRSHKVMPHHVRSPGLVHHPLLVAGAHSPSQLQSAALQFLLALKKDRCLDLVDLLSLTCRLLKWSDHQKLFL